ncbi:hypothetical protein KM295_14245 [Natronomonas sp. F2-12]|uniref:Type I phosphodiesterase / nucleotide pyrophosphatase n=1 Tax=Natronomonas aquatica TaxID=2841590 RepID=A0A9R1D6R5_9EURY|nr:hypothetical protein [Natronomonas aquatica]MCQ4334616.1 hypothetical protein [Natronomonas aquatica]
MTGPIIVLGWDGLDIELMGRFGVAEAFGDHRQRIDTHVNDVIDDPHTRELWPSMITGVAPAEHGIHAATENGVAWNSSILRAGSRLATNTIPDDLQAWLGKRLREQGVGLDAKTPAYYHDNDISTVFDGGGRAISIPNYETERDRARGLDGNRDALWATIEPDKSLDNGMAPGVDRETLYHELGRELGQRVGETTAAITAGEPLVWCWFGLLDTVGHLQPALGDQFVREWYEVAAGITETVRSVVPADATVLAISDHGIQEGTHEHYATVASDDPAPVEAIEHVFEVADWIRQARVESAAMPEPEVSADGVRDVQAELQALGYTD